MEGSVPNSNSIVRIEMIGFDGLLLVRLDRELRRVPRDAYDIHPTSELSWPKPS